MENQKNKNPFANQKIETNSTLDNESIREIIKAAIVESTTLAELTRQKYNQEQFQKRQDMYIDRSGGAAKDFTEKMNNEIKNGNYTSVKYRQSLADKFGNDFTFTISGYTLYFKRGYTVKVPNSIYDEVDRRFENSYKVRNDLINNNGVVVHGANRKQLDKSATNELSNTFNSNLNGVVRPDL